MRLDTNKYPLLFSAGTKLAYKIAQKYYSNTHYVWCSTLFDSFTQAPTSNPATIVNRYLEQITKGDRHAMELKQNIEGILRGAKAKLDSGVIDEDEFTKIRCIVSEAEYADFFPVVYIIDSKKVKGRCKAVPIKNRASDKSTEYKIVDLKEGEFTVIHFESLLNGIVCKNTNKVGE